MPNLGIYKLSKLKPMTLTERVALANKNKAMIKKYMREHDFSFLNSIVLQKEELDLSNAQNVLGYLMFEADVPTGQMCVDLGLKRSHVRMLKNELVNKFKSSS